MDSEERERDTGRPGHAQCPSQPVVRGDMSHAVFFLRTGVQLAEDDGHSHMTQGHSARSKRSAYPSTSRGEREALLQERALGARADMPWGGCAQTRWCTHTDTRWGVCTDMAVYTH